MRYNVADFIDDMAISFKAFHESEEAEEKWADMMATELKSYSPEVLKEAVKEFRRTRKVQKFPTPAECIEVCNKAARDLRRSEPAKMTFEGLDHARGMAAKWDAGENIARELIIKCRPNIAIQAAKEGWIGTLWAFTRTNGRLPREKWEVSKLQAEAKGFDKAYEDCVKGGFTDAKKLEELGAAMLRRREELRSQILGAKA